jgi:hypothetical protein
MSEGDAAQILLDPHLATQIARTQLLLKSPGTIFPLFCLTRRVPRRLLQLEIPPPLGMKF